MGIVNKRILVSVVWAVAGFAIAVGVMAWAFALAGQDISEPATPSFFSLSPTPDEGIDRSPSQTPDETPTSERDDDNSGPGGGSDDNSGPGSDDSGSGSSSSGSGSSGSSDRDDD